MIFKNHVINITYENLALMILLTVQVFHVRSVTQGDVIRAEAREIPRIFQVNRLAKNMLMT